MCVSHATIDAQVAGTYKSTGQKETANENLVLIAFASMCRCSLINTQLRFKTAGKIYLSPLAALTAVHYKVVVLLLLLLLLLLLFPLCLVV